MTTTISRRRALQTLAAALPALPALARAATPHDALASSYAPYAGPFNDRFAGEISVPPLPVEGRLPADLHGTLYRNGPARMRLGKTTYRHGFDGDGMVQAFTFAGGRIAHRGVLLRTPKLLAEEAAGRFLYPAFGTSFPDAPDVRNPDAVNVANINLLATNGGRDLYALWEAGSALQIDARTLAARGFKAWSPETAGAPFSAHPRVAPDGTVWSFGYLPGSGKLLVYEIGADGRLVRHRLIDAPQADMVHDFAITARHLVFLLMPLQLDAAAPRGQPFAERLRWDARGSLVALVVDKSDFTARRFELPNGGVFHLGNAWEERGAIRLAYARHPDLLQTLRALRLDDGDDGNGGWPRTALPAWTEVRLDLASGRATQEAVVPGVEFPRFDARRTGERTAVTVLLQRSATMPAGITAFDTVIAVRDGGRVDRHAYGNDWIAEEHVLVPRRGAGAEDDGWIIGTAYDWRRERTAISVFDARALHAGPLARLLLPYGLPLGLHGQFVAAGS